VIAGMNGLTVACIYVQYRSDIQGPGNTAKKLVTQSLAVSVNCKPDGRYVNPEKPDNSRPLCNSWVWMFFWYMENTGSLIC
jgi:hypothetical protein